MTFGSHKTAKLNLQNEKNKLKEQIWCVLFELTETVTRYQNNKENRNRNKKKIKKLVQSAGAVEYTGCISAEG